MVRASALYMVIVIALLIGVFCGALIMAAGFYQLEYNRQLRYARLNDNLESGINILLFGHVPDSIKRFSLFNQGNDTVLITQIHWGLYDVGTVKAFQQKDTLRKAFTMARELDSAKWCALYMIDEDRSISVSGKTMIKGNVYIPKAGIRPAYVDNQAYQGDERLVIGHQYNSEKKLPEPSGERLRLLTGLLYSQGTNFSKLPDNDSNYSWFSPTHVINLGKQAVTISGKRLSGNLIIRSDTLLTLDSTAQLSNVIIMAKAIVVKSGFTGNCQLFATDSIGIEPRCHFDYPTVAAVLRLDERYQNPAKISLGENSSFAGIILAYEKSPAKILPFIDLGKNVKLSGQVYVNGNTGLHPGVEIDGSSYTNRFVYTSAYTRYENYLINLMIDGPALSPYYLTSDLLPACGKDKKILQWLQ